MKNAIAILLSLTIGLSASASPLLDTFKKLDNDRKGPFDRNVLQGSRGRIIANQGSPAGSLQFQAAFRNQIGKDLATNFDFYVGNLFTTNYYELMGEYVYNSIYSSHELDHQALLANSAKAMPKATSMVRHWVLEKYYLMIYPNTRTANAFRLRGISDAKNEQEYAYYFLDFYLTSMTLDSQYLPAYLLTKNSAIASTGNLDRARSLIASLYEELKAQYGDTSGVKRLYQIRNAVHNQLSEEVIGQIDQFLKDYPASAGESRLLEVQKILKEYYSVGASKIADLAKTAGLSEIQATAEAISKNGGSTERYLLLSKQIANLRAAIKNPSLVSYSKKVDAIVVIQKASQFLNKEISKMSAISSKDTLVTIINLVYAEGFLILDNWNYFVSEINAAADIKVAAALLPDIVEIANDTLNQAFAPSYGQWTSFMPKMSGFVDNTIKSSALNTASLIVSRIK